MYIFMDVHLALQAAANLQVLLFPSHLKAPLPWKRVKGREQQRSDVLFVIMHRIIMVEEGFGTNINNLMGGDCIK